MNIDLDHLHYWMQAIRQSSDPMRTMDAFWSGQLKSKEWLIKNLELVVNKEVSIDIHGGWVGLLASLLFQSSIKCSHIRSVDIDPSCENIATMMNKGEEMNGRFTAITSDMCSVNIEADIVINTSCEHINQDQYIRWLDNIPNKSLIVVQSNNYKIPEHIRIANSLKDFEEQSKLNIVWADSLELPLYTRYMIIGKK
jgi:hypothetical protein